MSKRVVGKLPESRDKDFWGKDAEQIKCNRPEKIKKKQKHIFRQKGNVAICTSCSFSHAVFLDTRSQEIQKGKIVNKKPDVKA